MKQSEIFAAQLNNETREFYLKLNEILENEGLIIRYGDSRFTNRVTYFPDTNRKQQPLVLRYTIDKDKLTVELKLNFIDCYTDIIEKMPEHIKKMFRTIRHCSNNREYCDRPWVDGKPVWIDGSPNCGLKRSYTLDGEHYHLCGYKYYFIPDFLSPGDAEYYAKIITAEVTAVKSKKKHNTAHYK